MPKYELGPDGFHLTPEGQKMMEAPEANCNRCSHFATCGVWRTCAAVEQQYQEPKLVDFLKTLPKICPNYDVTVE
jgi:hypothetical protein